MAYSISLRLLFSPDHVILLLVFTDTRTAMLVLKKQVYRDVLYICDDYPYYILVCLLFSTAIPTSLFN